MYYVSVFSLSGVFFLRSNYFKIISAYGPKYKNLDKSNKVRKSVNKRILLSCVLFIFTIFVFSEGLNHFQDSYESVEYTENEDGTFNYSSIESESEIVTECNHNEECVAANILDDSTLFSFFAPNNMEFDDGDPANYNETIGIFLPLYVITILWLFMLIFCAIYDFLFKKWPNSQSKIGEWCNYYDKKSYRSYGAFLMCISSLFPTTFLFVNQSQSLTFIGGVILFCALILLYYTCLYFYSYNHADFFDPSLDAEFVTIPAMLGLLALLIVLIYGIFAFPLDNVSDIWFYDFIVTVDEAFTFYTDSISFRYRLIDLFVTGFTIGIIASGILWVQEENLVGDAWKLIPMGLFLASGIEFILSIYGFIAMIVNEITSLNVVWVSPIILSILLHYGFT